MISVDEAHALVLALARPPEPETVALRNARGRVLLEPVIAERNQPPFRTSVMDGYAVSGTHESYKVVGETAAGDSAAPDLADGEAVRIFTGAPVPENADRVVIQEDVTRDGDRISLSPDAEKKPFIRDIGRDFKAGHRVDAPRRLTPAVLALIAAMNAPVVVAARRPVVAIIATGNELVMPGEPAGNAEIIASNGFALAAIAEEEGAVARVLPIARDTPESLRAAFDLAAGADLIVTIGGASVGDHDLVRHVAQDLGLERAFYKIAMRPGKPLMAGRLGDAALLGVPGNPVSSIVCAHIFMRPLLRAMQGLPAEPVATQTAILTAPLDANGPRQHYMRARLEGQDITVADQQDSSLLTVLAWANALVLRPPHDPARAAGEPVAFIEI